MPRNPRLRRVPDEIRLRVSRACAVCRARKSRCIVRHAGACERCEEKGVECDLEVSQASQSPAISVISEFGRTGRTIDTPSLQTTQVRVLGPSADNDLIASSEAETVFESSPTGAEAASRVRPSGHQSPNQSEASESAILIVEDLGRTCEFRIKSSHVQYSNDDFCTEYTGLRSNESFLLCVQDVLHATTPKRVFELADRTSSEATQLVSLPHSKESDEALKSFPPQEIAAFLVSTFFYYVEATFFYCDRDWFHATLNSVFTGAAPASAADDTFICFALLVFAFGSQFAHLRSRATSQDSLPSALDPGKRFYDCAQKLIPKIIATCTLKGIQVCLLAGLYNLPHNLPDTSYLYLGMAMRMSIASGLHRKTLATTLDPRTMEVRNRLWWSVYSIDKRLSIALGRPSSIAEDAIDAPFPKYHHSLDNLEYQSNVQHQFEYLKLTRILSQIVQDSPLESRLSCVKDLSQQLKQWRSQLFSNLHPNDLLPGERNFRTTVHLHIHYHWAWILMGRASLLQISRQRIQALSKSATSVPDQPLIRTELATLCVDAAKATIELILVLKKHNLLCRFSFTDHHASTAALIVLILHSIIQHGDETSKIIDAGVDMLSYIARGGCLGASSDLRTVEQLRKLASDLRQNIYQGNSDTSARFAMQPTSMTDSYQAWVNWMSEQEASRSFVAGPDQIYSQLHTENLPDTSGTRDHEATFRYKAYSSDNMLVDSRSLDQGNSSWNFDTFNRTTVQGDICGGVEWDDGRLDVLDMTQFLGNYAGQTTYGQG